MAAIPRASGLDHTSALRSEGYAFISNRCRALRSDVIETRLLLERTICMQGRDAAALFYGSEHFLRAGATPKRVQKTLFGVGGVQGLDHEAHRHRKAMFLSLMSDAAIERLVGLTLKHWHNGVACWARLPEVELFSAAREILCRAACDWAAVPLPEDDVHRRTRQLAEMIEGASQIGPGYWRGKRARQEAESWLASLIAQTRSGRHEAPSGSALQVIAAHRDLDGQWLEERIAAVELLNVLRPVVAMARYLNAAAHALHRHSECLEAIRAGERDYPEWMAQEVRRYYPFFPFAAARVRAELDWRGFPFPAGRRVLLDLYGTNHDPRLWEAPEAFRPERFRDWEEDAFGFIPQGGGAHASSHRCPGEWIAIALLRAILVELGREMRYEVLPQDLEIDLGSMQVEPKRRVVITRVRAVG